MSVNLPSHYVQQYATNIQLLLQQKGSKLRPFVTTGSYVGKQASPVDQVGAIEMQERTSRFSPIGRTDAAVDRRWVLPTDYDLNQLIDSADKLRLLTDPDSVYVQNAVFAAGRKMDDIIIDALFGTAKTGVEGGTSTTFPSGNIIAAGAAGLTVAKLRAGKKMLMANQVDLETDPLVCIITAEQHDDLLAESQIISTDFNDKPVLVDGKVTRFLGINFIHCERLDVNGSSERKVPLFAKSGMHLGIWADVATDISQRKDLTGLPWQAYVTMTAGATRLEEDKVVQIPCVE